jgi:diadenylate cyclase
MGVVIRGNRIETAGVQFPLAESEDVDPSLGSRHRAALGLAKESDAVVLVVSEETGRISIAYEGQLYLGLEPGALRDMLIGLLAPSRKPQKTPKGGEAAASDTTPQPPSP